MNYANYCSSLSKRACSERADCLASGTAACSSAFVENRSSKQLHTRHCTSLGPQQYTCLVSSWSEERLSRKSKDIQTYRDSSIYSEIITLQPIPPSCMMWPSSPSVVCCRLTSRQCTLRSSSRSWITCSRSLGISSVARASWQPLEGVEGREGERERASAGERRRQSWFIEPKLAKSLNLFITRPIYQVLLKITYPNWIDYISITTRACELILKVK